MPAVLDDDVIRDGDALSSRPFRNAGRTGRQLSLCGTPEKSSYRQMSLSERSSIRVEEIIPAARVAIQVLDSNPLSPRLRFPPQLYNQIGIVSGEYSQVSFCLTFVFPRPWRWVTSPPPWPVSCV